MIIVIVRFNCVLGDIVNTIVVVVVVTDKLAVVIEITWGIEKLFGIFVGVMQCESENLYFV